MKRYILTLALVMTSLTSIFAMSYERARQEALYLTDKMAYELNLNDQQYNDAYEINLDYFLSVNTERDLYGNYLSYRLTDFRYILHDWQYDLMMAAHYFVRPIIWRAGGWHFPIYGFYTHGHFFYHRPAVYVSYRGGHGHHYHHGAFYSNRRPEWHGGLRGNDRSHSGRPAQHVGGRGDGRPSQHVGGRGDGYHFDMPGRGSNNGRGNGVSAPNRGNGIAAPGRGSSTRGNGIVAPSRGSSTRSSGTVTPSRGSSSRGSSTRTAPTTRHGDSFGTSSSRGRVSTPSGSRGGAPSRSSVGSPSGRSSAGTPSVGRGNATSRGGASSGRGSASSGRGGGRGR